MSAPSSRRNVSSSSSFRPSGISPRFTTPTGPVGKDRIHGGSECTCPDLGPAFSPPPSPPVEAVRSLAPTRTPPPAVEAVARSSSRPSLRCLSRETGTQPSLYLADINGRDILAAVSRCLQTLSDRFDPRDHEPLRLAVGVSVQSVCKAAKLKLLQAPLQTRHF